MAFNLCFDCKLTRTISKANLVACFIWNYLIRKTFVSLRMIKKLTIKIAILLCVWCCAYEVADEMRIGLSKLMKIKVICVESL